MLELRERESRYAALVLLSLSLLCDASFCLSSSSGEGGEKENYSCCPTLSCACTDASPLPGINSSSPPLVCTTHATYTTPLRAHSYLLTAMP